KPRSEDALRDVRKQYRRNKNLFAGHPGSPTDDELPIYGTMASKFNDVGVNALFRDLSKALNMPSAKDDVLVDCEKVPKIKGAMIPPGRVSYLRDIAETCRTYNTQTSETILKLRQWESLDAAAKLVPVAEVQKKAQELAGEVKGALADVAVFDDIA